MKKYTQHHEWLSLDGDTATVGITAFAAQQLGDLVYVELPELNSTIQRGEEIIVIESVKAAGEVLAPCDGVIVAINEQLQENPEIASTDPEGAGWLIKIRLTDTAIVDAMMDKDDYDNLSQAS